MQVGVSCSVCLWTFMYKFNVYLAILRVHVSRIYTCDIFFREYMYNVHLYMCICLYISLLESNGTNNILRELGIMV